MPPTHVVAPLARLDDPGLSPRVVGNKFASLAAAHRDPALAGLATVPAARCVPVDWLTLVLGPTRLHQLHELLAELHATLGNNAGHLQPALDAILDGLTLTAPMRTRLTTATSDLARFAGAPFAVRSSATDEDGLRHSHAGLYDSYLHVKQAAIEQAVLACWRSYYSPRAILGRVRLGHRSPGPGMAVIVQRMVRPHRAGVAFTHDNHTLIDSTEGTAEQLVAGTTDAQHTRIPWGAVALRPYADVARLAEALRERRGHDIDIEWAAARNHLHLLQVRPVTAAPRSVATATVTPRFISASLYFDDDLPPDLELGDVATVYFSYTAKRSPIYRLADAHGITTGRGWVLALNGAGLANPQYHPNWWSTLSDQVVLDLGPALRQHILPTAGLAEFLRDALNLTADPTTTHPAILREFVQGQAGVITSRTATGATLVEYAPQGLLAINRGLAQPERLLLPAQPNKIAQHDVALPDGWQSDTLHQMTRFTNVLDRQIPHIHAEWVILTNGRPQFVDFSTLRESGPTKAGGETVSGTTVISAGTAHGPLIKLEDNEALTKLSVAPIISVNFRADTPPTPYVTELIDRIRQLQSKPIIHAYRPYAILSLLIDHAAGFIFSGGSTLCHLAILLREAHIPALIVPNLQIRNGSVRATLVNNTAYLDQATRTFPPSDLHE